MKFTLFYSGRIRSSNKRNAKHINKIREAISPQIKKLYEFEPLMSCGVKYEEGNYSENDIKTFTRIEDRKYSSLINRDLGLACKLVITFYETSGSLSTASQIGDMDNKTKTLIDALKLPSETDISQLDDCPNGQTVHCLLMDDAYLWEIGISKKRLLSPDLCLGETFTQIDVEVIPRKVIIANISLFGVPVF